MFVVDGLSFVDFIYFFCFEVFLKSVLIELVVWFEELVEEFCFFWRVNNFCIVFLRVLFSDFWWFLLFNEVIFFLFFVCFCCNNFVLFEEFGKL